MKIVGREIKIKIQRCSQCGKSNIDIEIHTKKWFKGKKFKINNL